MRDSKNMKIHLVSFGFVCIEGCGIDSRFMYKFENEVPAAPLHMRLR